MRTRLLAVLASLFVVACVGDFTPGVPEGSEGIGPDAAVGGPVTFSSTLQPIFTQSCSSAACHAQATPGNGNYATTSYTAVLGNGSDGIANVLPGDANSLLVQYMNDNHSAVQAGAPGIQNTVLDWVVNEMAAQ